MESLLTNFILSCRPVCSEPICSARCPTERSDFDQKTQHTYETIDPVFAANRHCQLREQFDTHVKKRVKMEGHPFGMNVKTDHVPLVAHVAPGSAAEAAGVRAGDVVTSINGKAVTAENWYALYLSVPFPIILTLITYLPNAEKLDAVAEKTGERVPPDLKWDFCADDFVDFETYASSLPYGMRTSESCHVEHVIEGSPAEKGGVETGDILVSAAYLDVIDEKWYNAGPDSPLPHRLIFRRRKRLRPADMPHRELSALPDYARQAKIIDVDDVALDTIPDECSDVDVAGKDAVQERRELVGAQEAKDMRRMKGLEVRKANLSQAELECSDAQESIDTLMRVLASNDPTAAEDENPELLILMERLTAKTRCRDALQHDVSMWKSWMDQSDALAREHLSHQAVTLHARSILQG